MLEEMNEKPSEEFVNDELSRLQSELVEQREYSEHLHNTIHTICTSHAWKITEPLRIFESWAISRTPQSLKRTIKVTSKAIKGLLLRGNGRKAEAENTEVQTEHQKVSPEWIPRVIQYDDWEERKYEFTRHDPIDASIRVIAHYLPQFHPFEENDLWWGKGFTEWRNVTKAKPIFTGHHQPRLPSDLGFYDLRLVENMREQARMAKNYGIYGFAYYFYWFSGKTIMDLPLKQMLEDKSVDMPFCLSWANENWTRRWDGLEDEILIKQSYTREDSRAFIEHVLTYMEDSRYIKVDNCPVLIVYKADEIPNVKEMTDLWRNCAKKHGHPGLYLIAVNGEKESPDLQKIGFDAAEDFPPRSISPRNISSAVPGIQKGFNGGIYDYREAVSEVVKSEEPKMKTHPCVMLHWDNTARRGIDCHAFTNFKLKYYKQWLSHACHKSLKKKDVTPDERIVFINAWNEWAEGTYLEPDQRYGYGYLESSHDVLKNFQVTAEEITLFKAHEKKNNQALIIHLHYLDVWPDLEAKIKRLQNSYDLYVTCTTIEGASLVRKSFKGANIQVVENRGRDILPFIITLRHIAKLGYECCCKIHGKKSVYRNDGTAIRDNLLSDLLDNEEEIVKLFKIRSDLGLVVSEKSLLDHDFNNMAANTSNVETICKIMKVSFRETDFPAGSMYWFAPKAVAQLASIPDELFDIERGLTDGAVAHAVERIISVLVRANGCEVADQSCINMSDEGLVTPQESN